MLFMFQLLGIELVRMAKTRFRREEEKIEERRPSPLVISFAFSWLWQFRFRYFFGALHCEHCLFDNKALEGCWTLGNYTLLYIAHRT